MRALPLRSSDPRLARSRDRVLAAAIELLLESGSAGLTVDGVANRSGVAKTTIYRQFLDRDAIHIAAVESSVIPIPTATTDDLVGDVAASQRRLASKLRSGEFASLLSTTIDAAERSTEFATMTSDMCRAKRSWIIERLELANRSGEFSSRQDPEALAGQLVGPIFYRRLLSRESITDRYVTDLTRAVLMPLMTQPDREQCVAALRQLGSTTSPWSQPVRRVSP